MNSRSSPLGEVATIEREGIDPRSIQPGAKYVGLEHIDSTGSVQYVSVANGELASTKFSFTPEHILFGKLRPYLRKVARPEFSGICSTDIIPIKPTEKIDRGYLFYFLRQDEVIDKAASLATGVNLPRISPKLLETFDIPLPPLDEQRRIAAILDQADGLRRKRRVTLETLEAFVQADFIETFCRNPDPRWPEISVAEICKSIRTGPFGSQLLHSEFTSRGIAVLGIDNAVNNEFRWDGRRYISETKYRSLQRYRVFPRDLLITIMGTCGRAAIVPNDIPLAINTKHLCCLTLDEDRCLPEFLHACFLLHPSVLHQLGVRERGAVMAGLNMGLIKETKLALPPIDLQRSFAARVAAIDKLKAEHRAHLAKLDALFASLQHRAFRGEL